MRIIIAVAVVLALASSQARAGERVGDAALGALSGAVVLGPVGLVAGAVVGYAAGPSIARSWRANRHQARERVRPEKRRAQVAATRPKARKAGPAPGDVT